MERFYLLFTVGGRELAVLADSVGEVVALPRLTRPPASPPLVEGLMNLRGKSVPVIKLARLLGLSEPIRVGLFSSVIIFRDEPVRWAALVERALDVVQWPDTMIEPAPGDLTFNDCVSEIAVEAGARLVPVVSLARLLERRERQLLAAFHDQALRRQVDWKGADA